MHTLDPADVDAATPHWPVLRASLTAPPTLVVNGVSTALADIDPQADAVAIATRRARELRRGVRLVVTVASGASQQVIVDPQGAVIPLPMQPPPATFSTPPPVFVPTPTKRAGVIRSWLLLLPRFVRWGLLALLVVMIIAVGLSVTHRKAETTASTGPAPLPPAGQLYTDLPPPGWSQQAAWTLPIADNTLPAVDPVSGISAAVTNDDRSSVESASQRHGPRDQWLSILAPDGSTKWAYSLGHAPSFGPVITKVDGATVALVIEGEQIRYWPLDTGVEVDVDAPSGGTPSAAGESVLFTLPSGELGYLHGGAVQTVRMLPRTGPGIAIDGAVLVTQPDTGTWWTLRSDAPPTAVHPRTPAGAGAVDKVLAITPKVVVIAWNLATPDPSNPALIIAEFDRKTGAQGKSTTTTQGDFGQPGPAFASPTVVATGSVVITPDSVGVAVGQGFVATAAVDRAYGMLQGQPAMFDALTHPVALPEGTLIPVGMGPGRLFVVSQGAVYALLPAR